MVVSLLRFTISPEKQTHTFSRSPSQAFKRWQYPSLPYARVHALLLSHGVFLASSPEMECHRLPDDQPLFDQPPDLLMGVGVDDSISLNGVQSDLFVPQWRTQKASLLWSISMRTQRQKESESYFLILSANLYLRLRSWGHWLLMLLLKVVCWLQSLYCGFLFCFAVCVSVVIALLLYTFFQLYLFLPLVCSIASSIPCRAGLVDMNSFSLFIHWKFFFLLQLWLILLPGKYLSLHL